MLFICRFILTVQPQVNMGSGLATFCSEAGKMIADMTSLDLSNFNTENAKIWAIFCHIVNIVNHQKL